jgi:hypothetical protein
MEELARTALLLKVLVLVQWFLMVFQARDIQRFCTSYVVMSTHWLSEWWTQRSPTNVCSHTYKIRFVF